MKFLIQTTLIGFATLCAAQLSGLPSCAKPCASSLPSQCNLDVSCICSDSSWITGISCCIKTQCSAADQQQTLNVAVQLCDTVNVKLPSAASCPASASATVAASSAVVGGNSATSAGESTAALSASAATNSAVSSISASGVSTTTTSATGSSSSTTTSTSSSATHASGAAQGLGSNMGAVGAAVAALALL